LVRAKFWLGARVFLISRPAVGRDSAYSGLLCCRPPIEIRRQGASWK